MQLLQAILLSILLNCVSLHSFFVGSEMQRKCVESAIGNSEILTTRSLDVNEDGTVDEIIIYGGDKLYLLIVRNSATGECKVVLNEYLTFRQLLTGTQIVTIREIALVEVTGDAQPELHVWLEKRNGGFRQEVALHAIYFRQQEEWKEALRVTQCLAASSFEIRKEQPGRPKVLYLDEDRHCDWPRSNERIYTFMRWNGSRFLPAERGTVEIPWLQVNPSWAEVLYLITFVISMLLLLGLIWIVQKRRSGKST